MNFIFIKSLKNLNGLISHLDSLIIILVIFLKHFCWLAHFLDVFIFKPICYWRKLLLWFWWRFDNRGYWHSSSKWITGERIIRWSQWIHWVETTSKRITPIRRALREVPSSWSFLRCFLFIVLIVIIFCSKLKKSNDQMYLRPLTFPFVENSYY